jgi:hypothetical protein
MADVLPQRSGKSGGNFGFRGAARCRHRAAICSLKQDRTATVTPRSASIPGMNLACCTAALLLLTTPVLREPHPHP